MAAAQAKPWRHWWVSVSLDQPFLVAAPTRGRAMADSFSRYREVSQDTTFGDFLRMATVRLAPAPAEDGYDYVRRNYGVDPRIGGRVRLVDEGSFSGRAGQIVYPGRSTAYVHVVLDGQAFSSIVHPSNVELLTAESCA